MYLSNTRAIMAESERRWKGAMAFSLLNGVLAAIMDEVDLDAAYDPEGEGDLGLV